MSRIAEAAYGDQQLPGFKEPTTSRDAAVAVSGTTSDLRERVYAAILAAGERGLTADEVAAAIGRKPPAVRPRLSELAKAERITRTGERRRNDTGLSAAVWRVLCHY